MKWEDVQSRLIEADTSRWPEPPLDHLDNDARKDTENAISALRALAQGTRLRAAEKHFRIGRHRLKAMGAASLETAVDGKPEGFRVCRRFRRIRPTKRTPKPTESYQWRGVPHEVRRLIDTYPQVRQWITSYRPALPPGRAPVSFDKLHRRVVAYLEKRNHRGWPLDCDDKGRRALLRFIRKSRELAGFALADGRIQPSEAITAGLTLRPFDLVEFDETKIDTRFRFRFIRPNGKPVVRTLKNHLISFLLDVASLSVLRWELLAGSGASGRDMLTCFAGAVTEWKPPPLSTPGLAFKPGEGYPSGQFRSRVTALDNLPGHRAIDERDRFLEHHDGVLMYGPAHWPERRPHIETLNRFINEELFRLLPGGLKPSHDLEKPSERTSDERPDPIDYTVLREAIEVAVARYNATRHAAFGELSPLDVVRMHAADPGFAMIPPDNAECVQALLTFTKVATIRGSKARREAPYVQYEGVKYRSPRLSALYSRIGQDVVIRGSIHDLRRIEVFLLDGTSLGTVTAEPRWAQSPHDLTLRKQILAAMRKKSFRHFGNSDIVAAFRDELKRRAHKSAKAAEQLARMRLVESRPRASRPRAAAPTPMHTVPRGRWVSLDGVKE